MKNTLTVGSLFSGIGGLDLGLERAGMTVIWQSEIDPYACRVLAKHWPNVPNLGDITQIDWSSVERPDVICGGYPCQPFSLAGVRRGESDPRHLWPHMLRAIRHLRPRYALLENVAGHLSMGFGRVLGDLAESGYHIEWDCIPAAAVGAPHRRDRIFAVAYTDELKHQGRSPSIGWATTTPLRPDPHSGGLEVWPQLDGEQIEDPADGHPRGGHADRLRDEVADAQGVDGEGPVTSRDRRGRPERPLRNGRGRTVMADADGTARRATRRTGEAVHRSTTIERPRRRRSGIGHHWAVEPDVGRVAHGIPSRIHGGGLNAHADCIEEARSTGVPDTHRLRTLRQHQASPAASSEPPRCDLCGHPLSALPCRGACAPWRLGSGPTQAEDVRCLREGVLGLLAQSGEDVQPYLSLGAGTTQRTQTMGRRVDRLRCLGNAVVPQVAEWIGRRIVEAAA